MENLKEIGKRIKKVREVLNLTQKELCDIIGIGRAILTKYENGDLIPSQKFLKLLKYELKVNPNWILTGEGEMFLNDEKEKIIKIEKQDVKGKLLPVLGYLSSGIPEKQNVIDWIIISEDLQSDFAMIVDIDDMEPIIPKRAIILVKKINSIAEIKDGDIVLIHNNGEWTLRRFYFERQMVILKAENKVYKDFNFSTYDLSVKKVIIGKVEALYLKF
jgi:transcriptional regulator with XRE-family HTH domain